MKLKVQSIHFDADAKLLDFVQRKVDKLEKYFDRMVDGEVFLKLNNEGIDNKTVEIKLNMPGKQLYAMEKSRTFEAATELTTEALRNQLKKLKTKVTNGRA